MHRPAGVTVIAVLDFIGGAACLILGLLAFAGGSMISSMFAQAGATGGGLAANIGAIIGVVFLVIAALAIATGVGLIKLAGWGRIIQIVLSVLGVIGQIRSFTGGLSGSQYALPVILLLYYVWTIWYLFTPGVKQAFSGMQAAPQMPPPPPMAR
jgi:hypothetical protein